MGAGLTLQSAYDAARRCLAEAGVETADLDARLLLMKAAGVSRERWIAAPDQSLTENQVGVYDAMLARRMKREPVAYILGEKEFWSLTFRVTPDILIPRGDSETLVAAVLSETSEGAPLRILDLGVGSGCLLLALLSERPKATGLGVDQSAAAIAVAEENARRLGLKDRAEFAVSDWGAGVTGPFDIIVSNPPYIKAGAGLMEDVALYEPEDALYAGAEGLEAYRRLLPDARRLLAPDGLLALEIGSGQAGALSGIVKTNDENAFLTIKSDLAGRDRVILVRFSPNRP